MSRAVFKKLSGDLRAEWFQQLTQESEDAPVSSKGGSLSPVIAASAPLPKSLLLRGTPSQKPRAGMMTQGLAKLVSSASAFQQHTASIAAEGASGPPSPTGGSAELSDSSNNSGPLSPLPNAPGSGTGARTPASASTLYNPAISRVLKVDKLHEPYISRRERKALLPAQQKQEAPSAGIVVMPAWPLSAQESMIPVATAPGAASIRECSAGSGDDDASSPGQHLAPKLCTKSTGLPEVQGASGSATMVQKLSSKSTGLPEVQGTTIVQCPENDDDCTLMTDDGRMTGTRWVFQLL